MESAPWLPSKGTLANITSKGTIPFPMSTVHQLDCTYFGQLNKSYQRQGFGVLQTILFDTYFGFWHNNQAHGLGMVVYSGGQVVYGHFNRGQLGGPALLDDGKLMQLGVFTNGEQNGIGFEYNYQSREWGMIRYTRGLPLSKMRTQQKAVEDGIPDMIMTQHSIYELYSNYLKCYFFQAPFQSKPSKENKQSKEGPPQLDKYAGINEVVVSQEHGTIFLGLRDQYGLVGLCCLYNRRLKQLIEAGYYRRGLLEGYCYQYADHLRRMIGPFQSGLKEGLFLAVLPEKTQAQIFEDDLFVSTVSISVQQYRKRQRAYNYEQKDFLSAKNSFEFDTLKQLLDPPETRLYFMEKKMKEAEALKETERSKWSLSPPREGTRDLGSAQRRKITSVYQEKQMSEGTSVALMRQKLREYNMEESQHDARLRNSRKRTAILRNNLPEFSDNEQEIAEEENPFDLVMRGVHLLNQSPNRISKQHNDIR